MARGIEAQLQASGRRFQMRRLIHVLVRGDSAMVDEPVRAQTISYLLGGAAGLLLTAVCVLVAVASPSGSLGDAPIVMARETGALYVRMGPTLHPVLNLASARLIARTAADPTVVRAAAIAAASRGPLVGIPGAPSEIGTSMAATSWMICDADRTTLTAGPDSGDVEGLDSSRAILATAAGENRAVTYLLYDGRRAEVDLRNMATVRALRIDGVVPREISQAVLDMLPELPAIAPPPLAGSGARGQGGYRIGQVLRVTRADTVDHYVVLGTGVQRVGDVAADLIRFSYGVGGGDLPVVAPSVIAGLSAVTELAVSSFPDRARPPLGDEFGGSVCAHWSPEAAGVDAKTVVRSGNLRGSNRNAADMVQADGVGPNVDTVEIPPGRHAYVRATGLTGVAAIGPLYLISDAGVRYGVHDAEAGKYLGVQGDPIPVPWPMLARLPRGPELSVEAASVLRDGLAP
ncbi:type VII secretion protein EccB [Mycobacterium sp. OTB74]|uniref:type VII secretion protein EccB n=1 Tax=Mycobacterium sp. OTB74 TaxID=1853452 RepID=UPI002476A984|nr:type VII secretion protein EccB [Mycobacterium sp. OTB74]MDH6244725.1 type VII secretion protein EccB [Mycobacterium sp. OTB74]